MDNVNDFIQQVYDVKTQTMKIVKKEIREKIFKLKDEGSEIELQNFNVKEDEINCD